jgi:dienelactone hydrolase
VSVIVLFHSVYGLRSVERATADRLRTAGHEVLTRDLYAGRTAVTIADGFALAGEVGWELITGRAQAATKDLVADAVLAGISMVRLWWRRCCPPVRRLLASCCGTGSRGRQP